MKNAKPAPVAVTTVCSLCGLDWHQHSDDPTTEDCIQLLKAELAKRPTFINVPYVRPLPVVPWQPGPYYANPSVWTTVSSSGTPRPAEITCHAISSSTGGTP